MFMYCVVFCEVNIDDDDRLHYASCPFLCPSVCLSVCSVQVCNLKPTKHRKIKIGINVPQGTSKWSANFRRKGQR